jgi:nucleotide-binding universal stress UspA family protein
VSLPEAPRILVATDFSAASAAAERVAREYARRLQASVHILHVVETGEDIVNALLGDVALDFAWPAPTTTDCGEGSSVCERPGAQNTRVARGMADAAALVAYGVP